VLNGRSMVAIGSREVAMGIQVSRWEETYEIDAIAANR
jgi:hypothetical protein